MSFGKIWKKQVQVPKGNVSLFKPKQGFELDVDKDRCCEEAKEYFIKVRIQHQGITEKYWWEVNGYWAEDCDSFINSIKKYAARHHLKLVDKWYNKR